MPKRVIAPSSKTPTFSCRHGSTHLCHSSPPFFSVFNLTSRNGSSPQELYLRIFTHLSHTDRIVISQTCRVFAHLVKPLLFSSLNFDGQPQAPFYDHRTSPYLSSRSRMVQWSNLDEIVDDILTMGIAPCVKQFRFSPELYVEGFVPKYRQWLLDQLDRETTADDIADDESDGFERDEEFMYVGLRRVQERRAAQPEREGDAIDKAERIWTQKIAEQSAKEANVKSAMAKLKLEMTNLKEVEVATAFIDLTEFGFDSEEDFEWVAPLPLREAPS
ncbi:hypothetical protein BDV96DRAFT_150620 [Lophiotrema nucula]|uniref:F-box domain-containing protein n=1 Tax=Lophiotrema nucula TaxID=690887 RepID=A0A6A5Z229_9PLEO|nr:hypothetical protein BDV96DRAFT_150620 [Lophiotrema nucula]